MAKRYDNAALIADIKRRLQYWHGSTLVRDLPNNKALPPIPKTVRQNKNRKNVRKP